MTTTKTVSLRIPYNKYEQIILECDSKKITITEYFERKIALSNELNTMKYIASLNLKLSKLNISRNPLLAKRLLTETSAMLDKL